MIEAHLKFVGKREEPKYATISAKSYVLGKLMEAEIQNWKSKKRVPAAAY